VTAAISTAAWVTTVHVVVFAAWFGTDIATFTISRRVVDPAAPSAVRIALAKLMTSIEIIARLCLPTMLATGLLVAQRTGWLSVGDWFGWLVVAAGAAWVGLVWTIHRTGQQGIGGRLTHVDLIVRTLVCATLWVTSLWSIVDPADGPFPARWLALKVMLLAVIITCGIAIRFILRPFGAAFGSLVSSTDDAARAAHQAVLSATIRRAQPFVGVIWLCLLTAALMAVAKPALGQ
jgi:hypothetical protein